MLFSLVFFSVGLSEEESMRKDIIANLCVSDKTHSQLLDYVSFQKYLEFHHIVFLEEQNKEMLLSR